MIADPDEAELDAMSAVDLLRRYRVLHRGEPRELSSGGFSEWYVDLKKATLSHPILLMDLCRRMKQAIDDDAHGIARKVDRVAGIEMGGVPLVVGISALAWSEEVVLPMLVVRRSPLPRQNPSVGELRPGDVVVPVDDVATQGRSLVRAVAGLRVRGAVVEAAAVVVDREDGAEGVLQDEGVELIALARMRDLMPRVQ